MTEKPDRCSAEVSITEDFDTGEKTITLRIFKNLEFEAYYILDKLGVYEQTITSTKWEEKEKEND